MLKLNHFISIKVVANYILSLITDLWILFFVLLILNRLCCHPAKKETLRFVYTMEALSSTKTTASLQSSPHSGRSLIQAQSLTFNIGGTIE